MFAVEWKWVLRTTSHRLAGLPGVVRGPDLHAKPLDWKSQGEESDNTDPLASHPKNDSLDSFSVSCHHIIGYWLTGVSARDLSGLVTDSIPPSVTSGGGVFIAHVLD